MWHVGIVVDLENTMEKGFALFTCKPLSSHLATTTLIRRCSCSADSAKIIIMHLYSASNQ